LKNNEDKAGLNTAFIVLQICRSARQRLASARSIQQTDTDRGSTVYPSHEMPHPGLLARAIGVSVVDDGGHFAMA
jgi:hypothetical protein